VIGPRKVSERPLESRWRGAARALERERQKEDAHRAAAQRLDADLARQLNAESMRFGVTVPADPLLLDVLAQIDVENPGEVWRWRGNSNNHGTMTVKWGRSERSVVRFLAEAFGVVEPDAEGLLYPKGDRDDVNPWHREWRAGSGMPVGRRAGMVGPKECVECGKPLPAPRGPGRPRTTCSTECAADRQRRAVREYNQRKRGAA
jgi:hypothetical protein